VIAGHLRLRRNNLICRRIPQLPTHQHLTLQHDSALTTPLQLPSPVPASPLDTSATVTVDIIHVKGASFMDATTAVEADSKQSAIAFFLGVELSALNHLLLDALLLPLPETIKSRLKFNWDQTLSAFLKLYLWRQETF
jgi:hypothetical protein